MQTFLHACSETIANTADCAQPYTSTSLHVQVAYKDTGEILAVDIEIIGNAGWNLDYSGAVIGKALSNMDATYRIPHLHFLGRMARTNTCSNTAMRGLGAPQARPGTAAVHHASPAV